MSIDVYKAIMSGGLNLSSPSVNLGNDAIRDISALESELDNPLLEPLVDTSILSSTKTAIRAANTSANASVFHMTSTLNNSLTLTSRSNAINKLDAKADGVAKGCSNTTNMFGSIQGETDSAFSEMQTKANELSQGISDLLAGVIDASELESMMTSVSDAIGTVVASVESLVSKEQELGKDLIQKMEANSVAQAISTLWKDPCTQAVLDTVLPQNIKDLL
ncbi:DUF7217 family protein [Vibrio europaeus]|uniref:DUF7217 family protein n=1 Tax=Vibrio europaeus TaxID=300876 RepID=UPI00233F619C|nr:hypothetical protein [Vibrio europaeus]MDC5718263.1 hypothetical protein [Vibrio europaeus]